MIVCLSILMILCTLVLPQTILLLQERKNTHLSHTANVLLQEQMTSYLYDFVVPFSRTEIISGRQYTITWSNETICIAWHDTKNTRQNRCHYVKK
ncbi:hypothetical protein ACFDTO_24465 [Microbacteriaceae bacterium 4G12]